MTLVPQSQHHPTPHRVNYDAVAPTYDRRYASTPEGPFAEQRGALAAEVGARAILDLGCGTGYSLTGLAPNQRCVGLDASFGMLRQAQSRLTGAHLVQAQTEMLPFVNARFDLIWSVLAFHHFADKGQVVREVVRLLRPGGTFAIFTFDPRDCRESWYLYDYFDGVYERDLARFPSLADLEDLFRAAGLEDVTTTPIGVFEKTLVGDQALTDHHSSKAGASQLALLTDAAYQAGRERIRAAIRAAEQAGTQAVFRVRQQNSLVRGRKRG